MIEGIFGYSYLNEDNDSGGRMNTQTNNMTNLKRTGLITVAISTILSAAAIADVSDKIEKNYDFNSNGRIQLSNINGDVTINACDCSQVTLSAEIKASSQEMRDRISIEIENNDSHLNIQTKYKDNRGSSWHNESSEVIYALSVPNNVRLETIELVNGDLNINGITGALEAELVNGDLKSDGATNSTHVEMVNGSMEIHFDKLDNTQKVELEAVNGNIAIYLPSDADATIDAETVSGKITNDFDLKVIKHKYVGSEMRGKIGNGNANIQLENVNGKISVNAD